MQQNASNRLDDRCFKASVGNLSSPILSVCLKGRERRGPKKSRELVWHSRHFRDLETILDSIETGLSLHHYKMPIKGSLFIAHKIVNIAQKSGQMTSSF